MSGSFRKSTEASTDKVARALAELHQLQAMWLYKIPDWAKGSEWLRA